MTSFPFGRSSLIKFPDYFNPTARTKRLLCEHPNYWVLAAACAVRIKALRLLLCQLYVVTRPLLRSHALLIDIV